MSGRRWAILIVVLLVVGFAVPVVLASHGHEQQIHGGPVPGPSTRP